LGEVARQREQLGEDALAVRVVDPEIPVRVGVLRGRAGPRHAQIGRARRGDEAVEIEAILLPAVHVRRAVAVGVPQVELADRERGAARAVGRVRRAGARGLRVDDGSARPRAPGAAGAGPPGGAVASGAPGAAGAEVADFGAAGREERGGQERRERWELLYSKHPRLISAGSF